MSVGTAPRPPAPERVSGVEIRDVTPERRLILLRLIAHLWRGEHKVPDPERSESARVKSVVSIVPDAFLHRIRAAEDRITLMRGRYTRTWHGQLRVAVVDTIPAIEGEIVAIRADVRALMEDLLAYGIDRLRADADRMWSHELASSGPDAVAAVLAKYPRSDEDLLAKFGGWAQCGVGLLPLRLDGPPEHLDTPDASPFVREAVSASRNALGEALEGLVDPAPLFGLIDAALTQVRDGDRLSDASFTDLRAALLQHRDFGAAGTSRAVAALTRALGAVDAAIDAGRSAREERRHRRSVNVTARTRDASAGLPAVLADLRRVLADPNEHEVARAQIGLARRRRLRS